MNRIRKFRENFFERRIYFRLGPIWFLYETSVNPELARDSLQTDTNSPAANSEQKEAQQHEVDEEKTQSDSRLNLNLDSRLRRLLFIYSNNEDWLRKINS